MQTAVRHESSRTTSNPGVVYRTVCQNPGCGFKFDLRITPENASLLSGSMACPALPAAWWTIEIAGSHWRQALRCQAVVPRDRRWPDA